MITNDFSNKNNSIAESAFIPDEELKGFNTVSTKALDDTPVKDDFLAIEIPERKDRKFRFKKHQLETITLQGKDCFFSFVLFICKAK